MKIVIKSYLLFFLTVLSFNLACSQKSEKITGNEKIENTEKSKLIGKTFKGNIGSRCVETMPPDPCAGSQFYLIMKFKRDKVEVTEEEVGDCGKSISKNNYLSNWDIKNNEVSVKTMTRYGQPLVIEKMLLANNKLSGSEIDITGNSTKYVFEEVK